MIQFEQFSRLNNAEQTSQAEFYSVNAARQHVHNIWKSRTDVAIYEECQQGDGKFKISLKDHNQKILLQLTCSTV